MLLVELANLRDLIQLTIVILQLFRRYLIPISLQPGRVFIHQSFHGLIKCIFVEQFIDHGVQSTLHILVAFCILKEFIELRHHLLHAAHVGTT